MMRGRPGWSRHLAAAAAVVALILGRGAPVTAQAGAEVRIANCVSVELEGSHWAVEAVRRLEGVGLVEAQFAKRAVPACVVAQHLVNAAGRPDLPEVVAELLDGWIRALDRELPGLGVDPAGGIPRVVTGASASLGASGRWGAAAPGRAEFAPDRTGADPLVDRVTATASLEGSARPSGSLAIAARVDADAEGARVRRLEGAAGIGSLGLTVGRGPVGYGYARGGAVALADAAPVDRIEAATSRPFLLPGPARHLGGVTITTFFARIGGDRHQDSPFLWGARGSIRPHSRVTLAVHRSAMFGGDDENYPVTAERVLNMLIGRVANVGFEDQVVSVEGVFRLPTEAILPLTAYLEWGAEDAAGAWWDVPGRVIGIRTPMLPGMPMASAGVEWASFEQSCCGNPEWYRHWSFPGSWALEETPLGHPLGGHGRELRAFVDRQDPRRGVDVEATGFRRHRGAQNLYVPGREGVSWGGESRVRWRLPAGREIFGTALFERGEDWRESGFAVGGRFLLP